MKIIIKIGTSSLSNEDGTINIEIINKIARITKTLVNEGHFVIIVTSGAVGCGKSILQLTANSQKYQIKDKKFVRRNNYSVKEKTLLSGIGQHKLLSYYLSEFEKVGLLTEQVLIAGKKDLIHSTIIDNIKLCAKVGIIPIINANDTVYDNELIKNENKRFNDNDMSIC